MAAGFSARLVAGGHLERGEDGILPSAGRVSVAMDNLIERLRFALGEYDSEPSSSPEATAHILRFPTEASAAECKAELVGDAIDILVVPEVDQPGWRLYAVYPELSPDPDFRSRSRAMDAVAQRFGGAYSGSHAPPR